MRGAALVVLLLACTRTPRCVPGSTMACACPGSTFGVQACNDRGVFEPCSCSTMAVPTLPPPRVEPVDAGSSDVAVPRRSAQAVVRAPPRAPTSDVGVTSTCGGVGQPCCATAYSYEYTCGPRMICSGFVCRACGARGQLCCSGGRCVRGAACVGDVCR